jgi:hypothetical protein
MHRPHVASGGRYPVLRALAIMYILGAALTALGAVIYAVYALVRYSLPWTDRLTIIGGTLVGGFIAVISLLAVAELLKLFIDVEHNTRMAIPGRMGMPVGMVATTGGDATVVVTSSNNGGEAVGTTGNRITALDEETAEAALIRGH